MTTEDVKIRVTADADQLVSELGQATRALRGMSATAQKTSSAVESIKFQTMARNVAGAVREIGQMTGAAYEMATAWRDATKELGRDGLDNLTGGVDDAEESIRRIQDSFGALAATMLAEFAPALEVVAAGVRNFTVGAAFVIERVSLALTYLTQGEEAAFRQWTEHQGQLEALSQSMLQSTQGQIDVQGRAASAHEEVAKRVKEIGDAQRQLLQIADQAASDQLNDIERILAGHEAQLTAINDIEAATLALAETQAEVASTQQAATLARAELEARTARDIVANDLALAEERDNALRQADAQRVASREEATALILSNAAQGAEILTSLAKKGSKEAAAIQKASALFSIFVDTRKAFMNTLAGIPAPFNVPAAFSVAALGIAQGVAVASASPPSFDRGGVVDGGPQYPGGRPGQRLAQVEDGELVLTRKMQEAMGGGGNQTVILKVGSREFGRAVIASGATDGLQRRRGVGQRRYGG